MLRLITVSALGVALLSGCATTQNIISQVTPTETPLAQVLKQRPDLRKELATVEIRQYFNRVEAPTAAEVKITETGLMDDSVRSIRSIYHFKNVNGQWQQGDVQTAYLCARGKNTKTFQSKKCP